MADEQEHAESEVDIPSTSATEPVRNTSAIVAATTLLINGVVLFNLFTFTDEQKMWIMSAVAFFAPVIAGYFTRGKVFSPRSVEKLIAGLVRDRDRAQVRETAVREAAGAIQGLLTVSPPRKPRKDAQRPSESWDEPTGRQAPVSPPYQDRPIIGGSTAQSLAERQRRFLDDENTAEPQGYYDYPPQEYAPEPRYSDTPVRRHGLNSDRRPR